MAETKSWGKREPASLMGTNAPTKAGGTDKEENIQGSVVPGETNWLANLEKPPLATFFKKFPGTSLQAFSEIVSQALSSPSSVMKLYTFSEIS
ncbi:hypothetical protein [Algoriphagus sp.]|uniref:hypothetical protein n=1 Tax=Algoriphagus sp. TaxID=1872435 RepID=UPI00257CADEA|nr:hypothetical protein [Algoriphagus sp.]